MTDPRYCSNCRAELANGETTCASCGVFAGDVFDGRMPRRKRKSSGLLLGLLVLAILAGAAWWFFEGQKRVPNREEPALPSTRVVSDRPGGSRRATGAAITEAEAVRLLRRHLASTRKIRNECLAVISHGSRGGGYTFSVVDSCEDVRLGRWRVDGKTSAVSPAR